MADDTDLESHVAAYDSLIGMLKWGGVAVFVIAVLVIWVIAR